MGYPSPTVELRHRDLGGGGEPPLVILHGLLGSSRNWQTAGRDLAGRRRVYALDLRNHGLSPHADEMSYASMAADVVAWLDARGLGAVELMGHSMGGKVAMVVACREPGRVGRLVVVDISPRPYSWPERRAEFAAMNALDLGSLRSRAQAEEGFGERVPDWAMRKFLATNLERVEGGGWRWIINLPAISGALGELERNPLAPGERYGGPAHFIAGGRSDYVRAEDHAAIRAHFPAARITVLAQCGHNPHMEAREAFVEAVRRGQGGEAGNP
jgi:pimeloyl-ACP methyl ester carboxylesterase